MEGHLEVKLTNEDFKLISHFMSCVDFNQQSRGHAGGTTNVIYSSSGQRTAEQAGQAQHKSFAASGQDLTVTGENYTTHEGVPVVEKPYSGQVHSETSGKHFGWNGNSGVIVEDEWEKKQRQGGYQNQYDR